jgi:hypothetical protein
MGGVIIILVVICVVSHGCVVSHSVCMVSVCIVVVVGRCRRWAALAHAHEVAHVRAHAPLLRTAFMVSSIMCQCDGMEPGVLVSGLGGEK